MGSVRVGVRSKVDEFRRRDEEWAVMGDRASPVSCADEDVHNPSVDGLGTSWGVGAPEDRFIRYYAGEGRGGFGDGLSYG